MAPQPAALTKRAQLKIYKNAKTLFLCFTFTLYVHFLQVEHIFVMAENGEVANGAQAPSDVTDAVLKPSDPVPDGAMPVKGIEFDDFQDGDISVSELLAGMAQMGFQASSIGQAVEIINGMVCKFTKRTWCDIRVLTASRENGETPILETKRPFSSASPPT